MKHVLIPVDFSEHAVAAARLGVSLADTHGAVVTLAHVLDLYAHISIDPKVWQRYKEDQHASKRRELEQLRDELHAGHESVDINLLIRTDEPSHGILTAAADTQADLIVMASYGADAAGRFMLGSVAARAALRAPCPVMITRKDQLARVPNDARFTHPVVAVDYSRFSHPALELAAELVTPTSTIEVVHIFRWPYEGDDAALAEALADARTTELERLEDFTRDIDLAMVHVAHHADVGRVANQILDFARTSKTDLLVVGAHGRPDPMPHLGTVADRLLRTAPVPVLLVPESMADAADKDSPT